MKEEMNVNEQKYRELISRNLPRVIETQDEHEQSLALSYELMEKAGARTTEETALLKLLIVLISDYERKLNLFSADGLDQ